MKTRKQDTLWGIERDRNAPVYGLLVCPIINLWDKPERKKIIAKASHKKEVEILEVKKGPDGRNYYKVQVINGIAHGWVSEPFLKDAGEIKPNGGKTK